MAGFCFSQKQRSSSGTTSFRPAQAGPASGSHMLKGPRAFGLTPGRAFDFSSISVDAPIQAKLTVNAPGDAYEQEADQVASTVMRKPDAHAPGACACGGTCSKCSHGSGTPAAVQTKRFSPAGRGSSARTGSRHRRTTLPRQAVDHRDAPQHGVPLRPRFQHGTHP